jgi:hypothetical protein
VSNPRLTTAEVLEVIRSSFGAGTSTVTAGHGAPAEVTATPAVVMRPADPWVVPNRRAGPVAEVRWSVQILGNRYELEASMAEMILGYLAATTGLRRAGVGQIGPLGLVDPTTIAGVELLSGVFTIVLDWEAPDG